MRNDFPFCLSMFYSYERKFLVQSKYRCIPFLYEESLSIIFQFRDSWQLFGLERNALCICLEALFIYFYIIFLKLKMALKPDGKIECKHILALILALGNTSLFPLVEVSVFEQDFCLDYILRVTLSKSIIKNVLFQKFLSASTNSSLFCLIVLQAGRNCGVIQVQVTIGLRQLNRWNSQYAVISITAQVPSF